MADPKEKKERKDEDTAQSERVERSDKKEKEKTGNNKPVVIGIIVTVIIVEAIMLFAFLRITRPPTQAEMESAKQADSLKASAPSEHLTEGEILEEPIQAIVNIAGTDGMRFLKISVAVECKKLSEGEMEEFKKQNPKMRNVLLDLVSGMSLQELNAADAKDHIRKEFIKRANKILPDKLGQLVNAYITEFIMQ